MNGFTPEWFTKELDRATKECKVCDGTGNVKIPSDSCMFEYRIKPCACRLKVQKIAKLMFANIPKEFWKAEDLLPDWDNFHFEEVCRYANNLQEARNQGNGFLMVGENGVGKTFSGCHIISKAISKGYTGGYITAPEFMTKKRDSWNDNVIANWLNELMSSDFLVLDEVGKEYRRQGSDWVASEFDALLRYRRGNLMPTIIISNLTVVQFKERYGVSLWSILRDRMSILQFLPGDYRINGGKK